MGGAVVSIRYGEDEDGRRKYGRFSASDQDAESRVQQRISEGVPCRISTHSSNNLTTPDTLLEHLNSEAIGNIYSLFQFLRRRLDRVHDLLVVDGHKGDDDHDDAADDIVPCNCQDSGSVARSQGGMVW